MLKYHLILSLCSLFFVYTTQATTPEELAQANYATGHFEQAIEHWQTTLDVDHEAPSQRIKIMVQLSQAYQALGLSLKALAILSQAEQLADKLLIHSLSKNDALILTKLFLTKSDVFLATGQDIQARFYADKSLEFLPTKAPNLIHAAVLNNLGNVLTVEAYYANAMKIYAEAIELAQLAGSVLLNGRVLTNMAYAYSKNGQWALAIKTLSTAKQQYDLLELSYNKAYGLISVGELALRFWSSKPQIKHSKVNYQNLAYQVLNTAVTIAKDIKHSRLISYAYGFLGQLYQQTQRYEEALGLTRQAIFYAKLDNRSFFSQKNQASEILYRWQWQLGQLFKALHNNDAAISAYRNAVTSLQPIRQEMTVGYRRTEQSFRERIGPVYFELADLLLQRATKIRDLRNLEKVRDLKEALDTIELFKTAELQDYFQDECVIQSQSKHTLLDNIAPHTAIIYPILLPDRTVILLNLQNSIQQFSVPVNASQMKDEVNEFRFELEADDTDFFMDYAKRLYQWLIAPLSRSLTAHNVDTLIIIPDGVLRTIPFAALHDGKQYLIKKYAFVTSPGLTLTESKNPQSNPTKILLNGLSKSVQGYSALSYVRDEVKNINQLYPTQNKTQLLDQNFTVNNFSKALKTDIYSILHIASHGQFDSNSQKTFLLTYDGKITVDQLEALIRLSKRRQEPMELLTLSACQTAVGDDQAALGLAGIALKAGARSALASLWFIDDKATSILMKQFYQQLQQKGLSKAKALQQSQQYLLGYYRYQHPAYWAPFLLIGDWK